MLVIFSDIHFSDGTLDPFNVPAYAFRIVVDHLKAILERPVSRVKDIEIVLLGDVFDLLRSEKWTSASPSDSMPWSPLEKPLETRVDSILEGVFEKNADAISLMSDMGSQLGREVSLRYLPGNHDRALNKFPRTREKLVRRLKLDHDPAFPFELCTLFPRYNLFVEHGDRMDPFNCEGPNNHSCFGDAFVIFVMNNFFLYFRELLKDMKLEADEWVLHAVEEVDFVRPKWATVVWLQDLISGVKDNRVKQALALAWSKALNEFLSLDFERLGLSPDPQVMWLLTQLGQAGPSLLEDRNVQRMLAESDDAHVRSAEQEIGRQPGIVDFVVHGHTHHARHVPLSTDAGRPRIYFNSGAWRQTINLVPSPISDSRLLVPWQEMSFLVFYDPEESFALNKRYRYEMWRGLRS